MGNAGSAGSAFLLSAAAAGGEAPGAATLRERGLELKSGMVVFMGGGSILLRRQIEASGKVAHPLFMDDIRANAKGFEQLYRLAQEGR